MPHHLHRPARRTALVLAFGAVVSMSPTTVLAAPSVILNSTFNTSPVGSLPDGFTKVGSGTAAVEAVPSTSDRSLRLTDSSTSGSLGVERSLGISPGIVTFEYKIRPAQTTARIETKVIGRAAVAAVRLVFSGDSGTIRVYNGTSYEHIQSYAANTWYTCKLVLDTWKQTFDVHINGVLKKSAVRFHQPTTLELGQISFAFDNATTGSAHLDNVRVEIAPGPSDELREKYVAGLTGGPLLNPSDPDINAANIRLNDLAQTFYNTLNTGAARESCQCLWDDFPSMAGDPGQLASTYDRLQKMALAYRALGAQLYRRVTLRDAIIDAMRWLNASYYNSTVWDGLTDTREWANYEFSIPIPLNDLMALMYSDLNSSDIISNTSAIETFTPDPARFKNIPGSQGESSKGANRAWLCWVALMKSILARQPDKIKNATVEIKDVFEYVSPLGSGKIVNDGFYRDGSFIQHRAQPYNGGYGRKLIETLANMFYVTGGTEYAIEGTEPVVNWIYESFEPFIYRGAFIDSVRGRDPALSFETNRSHFSGVNTALTVAKIAQGVPATDSTKFKGIVKRWLTNYTYQHDFRDFLYPGEIKVINDIVDNSAITPLETWRPAGRDSITFVYPAMDRVLHRSAGFMFGVAMASAHILNYETTNGNNKQAWYTANGMTYLLNDDVDQYEGGYWATQDPYRRPGTTVAKVPRTLSTTGGEYPQWSAYGGGAQFRLNGTRDSFGTAGLEMYQYDKGSEGSTLRSKKSWFMFDNEVVALGSGVSCSPQKINYCDPALTPPAPLPAACGTGVETIVENRKLNSQGTNAFYVGEVAQSVYIPQTGIPNTGTITATHAHLAGTALGGGADIGYYFPPGSSSASLHWDRIKLEADWHAVSTEAPSQVVADRYLQIYFNHGTAPLSGGYVYALLPGIGRSALAAYAAAPQFSVLENSGDVHAVRETVHNCIGANFWKNAEETIGGGTTGATSIRSNRTASLMYCETPTTARLAIADPTDCRNEPIALVIGRRLIRTSGDAEITVVSSTATSTNLSINVSGALGRSFTAYFAK